MLYAERVGKGRWGDKTPDYVKRMYTIGRHLPEARFVHLIRDGRDVALSQNTRLARSGIKEPVPYEVAAQRWVRQIARARRDAERVERYLEVKYEDLVVDTEPVLRGICDFIELEFDPVMLDYHERADERLAELARDLPAREGKPWRPGEERLQAHALTREPPTSSRVGVWRERLSDQERREYEQVAGDLLAELGYPTGDEVGSPAAAR
jgi:sulfotransferase family protein